MKFKNLLEVLTFFNNKEVAIEYLISGVGMVNHVVLIVKMIRRRFMSIKARNIDSNVLNVRNNLAY